MAERDASEVLGYDMDGNLVTLRAGTNGLVCLADDPQKDGFSAACYPASLEGYMQRGRDLRAEGKAFKEGFDIREEAVQSGALTIQTNSILNGPTGKVNPDSDELENTDRRYVIDSPFATVESTGIPLGPSTLGGP